MMTPNSMPQGFNNVIELDRKLRKDITEYFFALTKTERTGKSDRTAGGTCGNYGRDD